MPLDLRLFSNRLNKYFENFGVTDADFANGTGSVESAIAELRAGSRAPSGDEVLIIADYFLVDYNDLISNERSPVFERTETLFRRIGSSLDANDRWAIQEFLFLCENEEYLWNRLSKKRPDKFAFTKKSNYHKGNGKQAARELRAYLHLPFDGAPSNVFATIRDVGYHVFRRKLDISGISGIMIRHPRAGKCLLVNYDEDVYRQCFTAAHECGHAILDDGATENVSYYKERSGDPSEMAANAFAGQFLLPDELVARLPSGANLTDELALEYCVRLKVNPQTLAISMKEAGQMTETESTRISALRVPRNRKIDPEVPEDISEGSKSRRAELLLRGLSTSYVDLCFTAFTQKIISKQRLSMALLSTELELEEIADMFGRVLSD